MAEQDAMDHRLQLHTLEMRLHVERAESAFREAINVATDAIAGEYSAELRYALEAQKFMFKENDAMQREELGVYREAWGECEQFQVLCQREVGAIAVERSELALQRAKLDSTVRQLLTQLRSIFEHNLKLNWRELVLALSCVFIITTSTSTS